jgi:hypothetical protein
MYQYQFKNGAFEVPANAEMMITSFQIPYSWYNITSRYNNNSFKIYWPNGAVGNYTAYTLTLDDGFYTVNALNARIQQFCIEKGMYLTDGSGNNVYYVSITPNSTAYANQIITKLVPLVVTGFTQPSNFAGYPTFIMSREKFMGLKEAKKKGKHWRTYLDECDELSEIREYANSNPKRPIVLQNRNTNEMVYVRYGKAR